MSSFNRFFGHLYTITKHRILVRRMCFKCHMFKQGLLHDLSKYSFSEFVPSVKHFQGNRSPISYEKELYGYSNCWLHHKGKNKHHWEYWIDRKQNDIISLEMPLNYCLESVLDKIAASKVYKKDKYTDSSPYEFFYNSYERNAMNKSTSKQILYLLEYLKDNGEKNTLEYIKNIYSNWKKDNTFRL